MIRFFLITSRFPLRCSVIFFPYFLDLTSHGRILTHLRCRGPTRFQAPSNRQGLMSSQDLPRRQILTDLRARDLATFPAGKALLEAEDHGDSATDPGYWWNKKKYYEAEYDKLQEEFWERWKCTHLESGETALESLEGGEFPPEVLNIFRPKTRARKSSRP